MDATLFQLSLPVHFRSLGRGQVDQISAFAFERQPLGLGTEGDEIKTTATATAAAPPANERTWSLSCTVCTGVFRLSFF